MLRSILPARITPTRRPCSRCTMRRSRPTTSRKLGISPVWPRCRWWHHSELVSSLSSAGRPPDSVGGLVTFGDSITDGLDQRRIRAPVARSPHSPDAVPANAAPNGGDEPGDRWKSRPQRGRLAQSASTRWPASTQRGRSAGRHPRHRFEGINDFQVARQNPIPTAEDLIAGHKQLIERAHVRGQDLRRGVDSVYGAQNYTDVGESKCQAFNEWVRTSHVYDAFIDFDKATQRSLPIERLLAEYDSCDHLHPNDAGYKAMAEAIDLDLFRPAPPLAGLRPRLRNQREGWTCRHGL